MDIEKLSENNFICLKCGRVKGFGDKNGFCGGLKCERETLKRFKTGKRDSSDSIKGEMEA